jgi:hypothetical protein
MVGFNAGIGRRGENLRMESRKIMAPPTGFRFFFGYFPNIVPLFLSVKRRFDQDVDSDFPRSTCR